MVKLLPNCSRNCSNKDTTPPGDPKHFINLTEFSPVHQISFLSKYLGHLPPQRIDDKRWEAKKDHLTAQVPGLTNAGIQVKAKDVAVSQMSPPILFTGISLWRQF